MQSSKFKAFLGVYVTFVNNSSRVNKPVLSNTRADSAIAVDLRPSLPFLVLFVLLVFWPKLRERREAADPLAGVDPPPPALAHEYKDAQMLRLTRIAFPVFVGGFLVVTMTLVSPLWVTRLTDAFALAVVLLSITIFTGLGGQISLAQATIAGFGGFAMANLMQEWNVPAFASILIGALVAAAAGALFVLLIDGLPALIGRLRRRPTVRLAGLYLSLATLAFALMAENVIFRREEVSGGEFGIAVVERHEAFPVDVPQHGPLASGGTANCTVAIGDEEIASPVASEPDFVVSMNQPSFMKFQSILQSGGLILVNSSMVNVAAARGDIEVLEVPTSELAENSAISRLPIWSCWAPLSRSAAWCHCR